LVLVVLLKYHGTDQKPPAKTSFTTGTRSLDLSGSGMASFIQRRTTDAAHHPRQMTNATIQLVINGNQVEGTMSQLAQMLGIPSDVMVQKIAPVTITQEEKSVKFVEFFGATLESHIKGGKLFVPVETPYDAPTKMKKGGSVSKRADGCCVKGKTKGKML
jgi:hypothetical protein